MTQRIIEWICIHALILLGIYNLYVWIGLQNLPHGTQLFWGIVAILGAVCFAFYFTNRRMRYLSHQLKLEEENWPFNRRTNSKP